jgi:hypothetical protein
MPTYTTNYNLAKPNVNSADDEDLWGDQLNDNLDIIDTQIKANADLAAPSSLTKAADYTLDAGDNNKTVLVDATAGNVTITADATLANGFRFTLIRIDNTANTVTFDPTGGQTVNGGATKTLDSQYSRLSVVSNATNWFIEDETLGLASAAETLDGALATKALTPAGFAGNKNLAQDGYYKFPGGLIIQWGTGQEGTNTLPTAFTSASTYAVVAVKNVAGSDDSSNTVQNISGTQFTYRKGDVETETCNYIAIGY